MASINADILRSKFGFNDSAVIEGILRDPNQVARYEREYAGMTGGNTSSSPSVAQSNPIDLAKQYQEFMVQANQPAIQQLQSSIPGVQQKFGAERASLEAEKNPLEQRYQSLLADVTKQTSVA